MFHPTEFSGFIENELLVKLLLIIEEKIAHINNFSANKRLLFSNSDNNLFRKSAF